MKSRELALRAASVAVTATLALCSLAPAPRAGTTGKLAGVVRDAKKQPLPGANVILVGVPLGAASDADGRYSILNVPAGTYTVKLDRSVLEEVQVISGTFDAEYGQAMSGVVNAVLKRGTQKFEWSGETFGGDYFYP